MTEEEAKTKWCPFARVFEQGSNTPAHNRSQEARVGGDTFQPAASACLGSACMAWRWMADEDGLIPTLSGNQPKAGTTDPADSLGYCGLAGAPQ